jgi:hypothetical protein
MLQIAVTVPLTGMRSVMMGMILMGMAVAPLAKASVVMVKERAQRSAMTETW